MNRLGAARHHCFYWRVAPHRAPAALDAVRRWQRELMRRHPSIAARLYVRHEPEQVTAMETYECEEAVVLLQLRHEGDAHTAPWRAGERHLESFSDAG